MQIHCNLDLQEQVKKTILRNEDIIYQPIEAKEVKLNFSANHRSSLPPLNKANI